MKQEFPCLASTSVLVGRSSDHDVRDILLRCACKVARRCPSCTSRWISWWMKSRSISACDGSAICTSVWKSNRCGTEELKYYFDPSTNMCQAFKYYSCVGNDNKFGSLKECQDSCASSNKQKRELSNRTRASRSNGHFRTIVQRLHDIVSQSARWKEKQSL